jgi:hypothetical protein
VKGHETPWDAGTLLHDWPTEASYVLEATYPDQITIREGETIEGMIRCKIIELPLGKSATETNLVPHQWAGDS